MNHKRWNVLPSLSPDHPLITAGLAPLIAQLLHNRGITEPELVEAFFAADKRLSPDPFLMPDMEKAVGRIYRAILGAEKIAVYGDFDADGITSTALLTQGLGRLTHNVVYHIPHRVNEGHGLKVAALQKLRNDGVSLVITVDCGVTGAIQVKQAKRLGLDIIVTDHHTVSGELPPAFAVVNPRREESHYPFPDLAGVGVAHKLLQALFSGLGRPDTLGETVDLVAVGTVADMTPLLGENRYLVREGLDRMNANLRVGLKELLARAGMAGGVIGAENITWTIAPRLNTASRLDHALPSYELLTTDSEARARELAQWLEQKNAERQQLTSQASARAREQVLQAGLTPVLIASNTDYPAGVSGLIASRLTEEFYRPSVVVREAQRVCTGSCRSIPEFNIVEALGECRDLFLEFGGHAGAAGFVMLSHNLHHFKERLQKIGQAKLAGVDLRPRIDIEAEVTLKQLGGETYKYMQKLAPFGKGNPVPALVSRKVKVVNCRTMGAAGQHLRLQLEQGGVYWDAVGFACGENLSEMNHLLDIAYNLELDQWNGRSTLRLNILDFATASS